jgi:hypothetical protein
MDTAECKFGTRQGSYLLDKFRIGRQREFRDWMLTTMLQTFYLQTVCLPPNSNSCPSNDDTIYKENLEMSRNAIQETVETFSETETCTCDCKNITLKSWKFSDNDDVDASSVPDGKIYVGVKNRDSSDKRYYSLGKFSHTKQIINTGLPYVVTQQADTIWVKIIEEGETFGVGAIAKIYEGSYKFTSSDKCIDYDVEFELVYGGKNITFTFSAFSKDDSECPEEVRMRYMFA